MNLSMQALFANAAAATMTAIVIAFPTPSDLRQAIVGQDRTPAALTSPVIVAEPPPASLSSAPIADSSLIELVALPSDPSQFELALSNCAFYLSRASNPDTTVCHELIEQVSATLKPISIFDLTEPAEPVYENLLLATAELCRVEWARDASPGVVAADCFPNVLNFD